MTPSRSTSAQSSGSRCQAMSSECTTAPPRSRARRSAKVDLPLPDRPSTRTRACSPAGSSARRRTVSSTSSNDSHALASGSSGCSRIRGVCRGAGSAAADANHGTLRATRSDPYLRGDQARPIGVGPIQRHPVNDLLLGAWARRHRLALDSRTSHSNARPNIVFPSLATVADRLAGIGADSGQGDESGLAHPARAASQSERVPDWGSRRIGYGHRGMRRLSGTRDAGCGCGWATDTGGFSIH